VPVLRLPHSTPTVVTSVLSFPPRQQQRVIAPVEAEAPARRDDDVHERLRAHLGAVVAVVLDDDLVRPARRTRDRVDLRAEAAGDVVAELSAVDFFSAKERPACQLERVRRRGLFVPHLFAQRRKLIAQLIRTFSKGRSRNFRLLRVAKKVSADRKILKYAPITDFT
jgi:hypothetical protein